MAGLTLDAGPVIAWDRHDRRIEAIVARMLGDGVTLTVPTVVVAEVWRGGPRAALISRFLTFCEIADVDMRTAKLAGELLGRVGGSNTLDAVVVASAALRGDRVITEDPADVTPLGDVAGVEVRAF